MKQLPKDGGPIKVAMVTNIPAPYRIPVYEALAQNQGMDLCVFFCSGREPDRAWDLQTANYKQVYFKEKFFTYRGRFIHCNPDVWSRLRDYAPDVIVTTGFNPSFILAYIYARLHGARHIAMTDGTYFTESGLSWVHRLVRRWIYGGTQAFIGASQGSFELYRSYGIESGKMFQSHLCANNAIYRSRPVDAKRFDFVFSARFIAAKNPDFAMTVAQLVARKLGRRTSLLMMGSGELDDALRRRAAEIAVDVDVVFAGFVKQADLPDQYASARVMLFPTQIDTWGVVANEAFAAGVPVIVSPMAGVAADLVLDGCNGYVLSLDAYAWADAAATLLSNQTQYELFAGRATERVQSFTYMHAAQGILDAVRHACKRA